MAEGRVDEVSRALDGIAKNRLFTRIEILDRNLTPRFVAKGPGQSRKERTLIIPIRPRHVCIRCHGSIDPIGYLRIGFDTSIYDERFLKETMINLGTSFAILLSLTIMVYICLQKGVFSRLQKINIAMQYFGKGNLKYRIKVTGYDELSNVARTFNDMARNIYKLNFRLFKISEFPTMINRCKTHEQVLKKTVDFVNRFFDINGVEIMLKSTAENLSISSGLMEGIVYEEEICYENKQIGYIKIAVSRDMSVEELSAIKIIASSVSMAAERIERSLS